LLDAKASGKRAPLRELGKHPKSGADINIFSGRYGPYVTDGEVNATLPKDVEPEQIDLDAALDLLAKKAGKGGKGRGRGRRGNTKAPAKRGRKRAKAKSTEGSDQEDE
jgi:DNA topoisomerase-1